MATQGAHDLQSLPPSKAIRILAWSLAGLVVLLTVLMGVTAAALPGCRACHDSKTFVTETRTSAHSEVECTQCHVQPGVAARLTYAYNVVFGMALHLAPAGSGQIATVTDSTCLSCHEAVMKGIVTADGISVDHAQCSKGRMCVDCHSDTAHGTAVAWPKTVNMNQCLDCHAADRVRDDCTTCHSERSARQRVRTGEWAVTHGPNWEQTHGMGDWDTCAACHPADYCVRCHGLPLPHDEAYIRSHPAQALEQPKDCAVCHKQAFCDGCHGLEMPHPTLFTPAHSFIVERQGSRVCMRCHVQEDCDTCHVRHVHPGGATLPPGSGLQ